MKTSILVSAGTTLCLLAATMSQAGTVVTEYGRPLLVETPATVAVCDDVAFGSGTEARNWQDAYATKRAHEQIVLANWQNALADKRVQDRAVVLAVESAPGCALTN